MIICIIIVYASQFYQVLIYMILLSSAALNFVLLGSDHQSVSSGRFAAESIPALESYLQQQVDGKTAYHFEGTALQLIVENFY